MEPLTVALVVSEPNESCKSYGCKIPMIGRKTSYDQVAGGEQALIFANPGLMQGKRAAAGKGFRLQGRPRLLATWSSASEFE